MTIWDDEGLTVPFAERFSCCNLIFPEYTKPDEFNKDFENKLFFRSSGFVQHVYNYTKCYMRIAFLTVLCI